MTINSPLYCPFCYIKSAADRTVSDHWHAPETGKKDDSPGGTIVKPDLYSGKVSCNTKKAEPVSL